MQLSKVVQSQRDFFQTNETKSIDFRKKQLCRLSEAIHEYMPEIYQALQKDLSLTDVLFCKKI